MRNWKAWLEDRGAHRAPVDAHFQAALQWIDTHQDGATGKILELGPGPELDLASWLRQHGFYVVLADLDCKQPDAIDLGRHWNQQPKRLPFPPVYFHAVLAREVMEHVDDIYKMVSEIQRVLLPGGRFWFSTLFTFPLHDYDTGDYWRLSPKAWDWLLEHSGFRKWATWPIAGRELWDSWQYPISVVGWGEK